MISSASRSRTGQIILALACTLVFLLGIPAAGYAFGWTACHWLSTACPVEITLYSSDTKEDWLNAVAQAFNDAQLKTSSGRVIAVTVYHVKSGSSMQDIFAGKIWPTAWSPGEQNWVNSLNQKWQEREGVALISEPCPATVYAPVGFAMFRPMAEALGWPDSPIGWKTIVALAADPQGWTTYGHPEWGRFKFGHTHPDYSNSGLLMLTALAYAAVGKTDELTAEQVKSAEVMAAMRSVELNTYHYGISSRDNTQRMVQYGPRYLHATNATEAETLRTNSGVYGEAHFPLVFIFPAEGTFWAEQPFCVLDAKWSSDEQREAAHIFRAYLMAPAQQRLAIANYLRPVDTRIPLVAPFTRTNGTDPDASIATVMALGSPSTAVTDAVKEVFHQTKKKATVLIVLDTSGSMMGRKLNRAREATANFLVRLEPEDQVYVYQFGDDVVPIKPFGQAGTVQAPLAQTVRGIRASGGTALNDAVCTAVGQANELRASDAADGEQRLYGVVVLSDGEDTASSTTQENMFECLPTGEAVEGVKVFTIAYGEDAEMDLLQRIADRTNGKSYIADPDSLEQVYKEISGQQ